MPMTKHRIGHLRHLSLHDSSRKLIVERPSKFDLTSSGLALNAVDEDEEPTQEPQVNE
jgi:hypothetical protein